MEQPAPYPLFRRLKDMADQRKAKLLAAFTQWSGTDKYEMDNNGGVRMVDRRDSESDNNSDSYSCVSLPSSKSSYSDDDSDDDENDDAVSSDASGAYENDMADLFDVSDDELEIDEEEKEAKLRWAARGLDPDEFSAEALDKMERAEAAAAWQERQQQHRELTAMQLAEAETANFYRAEALLCQAEVRC